MASKNTTRKHNHLQPVEPNPYCVAMRKLGLDWATIDKLADEYKSSGDDAPLVLTIALLRRLSTLVQMRNDAPETPENYLPMLIDRLYRATYHCEKAADRFAVETDRSLRARRVS